MISRIKILLTASILLLSIHLSYAGTNDTLYQVSTLDALSAGMYDGKFTLKDILKHGDTGLGTFQNLDGEMVIYQGTVYQITTDGKVTRPDSSTLTPFAALTFFHSDIEKTLESGLTLKDFPVKTDAFLPTKNLFYAFIIQGNFQMIKTRSVPKQMTKPYPVLAEVVKKQSEFEFENVEGTIVGLRCPDYAKGLNAVGYHLHFLTKDGKGGGHVIDFTLKQGTIKIDQIAQFAMAIPDNADFYQYDFSKNTGVGDKAENQTAQSSKK